MLKNLFNKDKQLPTTYQDKLQPQEVLDLFSRLTLHHQAALLRLISRNLVFKLDDESIFGYEMDFKVNGAMIEASLDQDDTVLD
jgi:hypothetical protein|tara:strand:+ start:4017 stop:4268 length:252 start_codon:yes stop_codon:yes gene_type:complete